MIREKKANKKSMKCFACFKMEMLHQKDTFELYVFVETKSDLDN